MDPNFSVLLGSTKDSCNDTADEINGVNSKLIGGLIGGIAGVVIISLVVALIVYPRIKLWKQTKDSQKLAFATVASGEEMVNIERRQDMEINTAAGNFVVRH